ncbi:MAG: 50S ribosomal protein L28 [Spirochaetes bacterium]|nr:50S ribosomal protein L28 [Spirochaetota bacterium]
MARSCDICGKETIRGNRVSHSNRRTRRVFRANLRTVKANVKGTVKTLRVCTSCISANKVVKAV